MTLVEKFDRITFNLEDQIPAPDKEWCEKEQADFKSVLDQLLEDEKQFEEKFEVEKQISGAHWLADWGETKVHTYWKDKDEYNRYSKSVSYYEIFRFSSAYAIEKIRKLKKELKTEFITQVGKYFAKKYNFDLPELVDKYIKTEELDSRCDYKVILELIKEHNGGSIDFKGGMLELTLEKIRDEFKYKDVSVDGPLVTFNRFGYGRGNSKYPSIDDRYEGGKWLILDNALSIFETDEIRPNYAVAYLSGKFAGEWDTPLNGEKLDAIRFTKLGKLFLRFKEASFANQFVNRFNLKTK